TPTPHVYTLSLHDALPIFATPRDVSAKECAPFSPPDAMLLPRRTAGQRCHALPVPTGHRCERNSTNGIRGTESSRDCAGPRSERSEEHTSELQSRENLVCR